MTSVRVRPGPVVGTVRAPPSKSYTHRALVVGHLSGRRFRVRGALDSADTRATAAAIGRLGSAVTENGTDWEVRPRTGRREDGPVRIDCGESGTTLRLVAALAARLDRSVELTGSPRLSERPIDDLLATLRSLGGHFRHLKASGLPVEVRGPIHGGSATLDASKSSQFASALLLTLPILAEDSTLRLTGQVVSEPYIEATLSVLAHHKIRVGRRGRQFTVPGHQRYRGGGFRVPGDASSAAYLWAAAALGGGRVRVEGIPRAWPQADLAILTVLRRNGASVVRDASGATVSSARRRPFRIDLTDSPDLYPLAGVLAATTPGASRLVGAGHVMYKESDRKQGTAHLARSLGAKVHLAPNGLRIEGTLRPRALRLGELADHRLVMSAAVGALAAESDSRIGQALAVRKSYPEFWSTLAALQGGDGRP